MQIDPIHIDGTTYNLTLDDVREYIVKDINNLQQRDLLVQQVKDARAELRKVRETATNFFQEEFAGNINDDEITFTKDELNEFLDSIGAEPVNAEWQVTLDVRITVNGVNAKNADDAEGLIERALNIDFDSYIVDVNEMDYEINSITAEKE